MEKEKDGNSGNQEILEVVSIESDLEDWLKFEWLRHFQWT